MGYTEVMVKMVPYETLEAAGFPGIITAGDVKAACAAVVKLTKREVVAYCGTEFDNTGNREWILYFGTLGKE